jgi:hypothetical protein
VQAHVVAHLATSQAKAAPASAALETGVCAVFTAAARRLSDTGVPETVV